MVALPSYWMAGQTFSSRPGRKSEALVPRWACTCHPGFLKDSDLSDIGTALTQDDEILQKAWEQLTILTLRKGFGVLWMHHFIADEFDKLCADPVMRAKIGVEPASADGQDGNRK